MAQLGYLYVAGAGDRAGEGLSLLFDAIQLIEKDEAKLELNACYALLGNAQLLLGRFTEARLAFQRNCDLCAEVGAAPHDEATAYMRLAQVALEVGDYRGARKAVAPAGALAKMVGDLVQATGLANSAIRELKSTALEADAKLGERLEEAARLEGELHAQVSNGSQLVEKIARITAAAKSQPLPEAAPAIAKAEPVRPAPVVEPQNKLHSALQQLAMRPGIGGRAA